MSFPTVTEEMRGQMWANFLDSCALGTVVADFGGVAWQKTQGRGWLQAGDEVLYEAKNIPWPVTVLHHGRD